MSAPVDEELVRVARELMATRYLEGKHQVAAALRTASGRVFSGVHVEAVNGRITVCAEAVAIGAAATAGDTALVQVVAVTESGDVYPPCGMCREMISDYGPEATVLLEGEGPLRAVPVLELLPEKPRPGQYPNRRKGEAGP